MRKFILILIITVISLSAIAQQTKKDLFEYKVERYSKMKKNGTTMAAAGGVATVIGIVLISQADWEKETTPSGVNYNTQDESGGVGILVTGIGAQIAITGIILAAIGNKKEKEYKNKLDKVSFRIKSTPQMTGFSLVYKF